jgi:hypothetical protein
MQQNCWRLCFLRGPSRGDIQMILRTIQKHTEERNLLNASLFGFRADHNTILQCMMLADHVTLNFNSNMSTAAVYLDIEKAFDTTWCSGLVYQFSKLEFSTSIIKLIVSFLTDRKCKVLVEGELSTSRKITIRVPQSSVFAQIL